MDKYFLTDFTGHVITYPCREGIKINPCKLKGSLMGLLTKQKIATTPLELGHGWEVLISYICTYINCNNSTTPTFKHIFFKQLWMNDYIPQITIHTITYSSDNLNWYLLVKEALRVRYTWRIDIFRNVKWRELDLHCIISRTVNKRRPLNKEHAALGKTSCGHNHISLN